MISKNGIEITSLEAWFIHAGPKSPTQWVEGRSAKEAARAWLEGNGSQLPSEVRSALVAHDDFGPVLSWRAEPEARLRFDKFRGEPRNSDLAVHAQDAHGSYLIAVEAKADEPFGETVAEALAAAEVRFLKNNRSNGLARIQQLSSAILGPQRPEDPPFEELRYQLLTACAGALCEAERHGYGRALMLVQEFVTDKTKDEKHVRNANDLDAFLNRLSHGEDLGHESSEIEGPFQVPGTPLLETGVALYVGKVRRFLRTGG